MNFKFWCKRKRWITNLGNVVNKASEDATEEEDKEVPENIEDIPVKVEEEFDDNDLYLLLFVLVWANCNRLLAYTVVFSSLDASLSSSVHP